MQVFKESASCFLCGTSLYEVKDLYASAYGENYKDMRVFHHAEYNTHSCHMYKMIFDVKKLHFSFEFYQSKYCHTNGDDYQIVVITNGTREISKIYEESDVYETSTFKFIETSSIEEALKKINNIVLLD